MFQSNVVPPLSSDSHDTGRKFLIIITTNSLILFAQLIEKRLFRTFPIGTVASDMLLLQDGHFLKLRLDERPA